MALLPTRPSSHFEALPPILAFHIRFHHLEALLSVDSAFHILTLGLSDMFSGIFAVSRETPITSIRSF